MTLASPTASRPAGPSAQAGSPQGLHGGCSAAGAPCPWSVSRAPPLVAAQPASAPTPGAFMAAVGRQGQGGCRAGPRTTLHEDADRSHLGFLEVGFLIPPPPLMVAASWGFCDSCVGGACFLLVLSPCFRSRGGHSGGSQAAAARLLSGV